MVETEGGGGGWIGSGQPQRRNSENRNSRVGNRGHKCSNVSKRCAPPARLYYTLFLSPEVIIVCEFLAPSPREKQRHFSFPPADTLFPTHPFDNRRVFPSFSAFTAIHPLSTLPFCYTILDDDERTHGIRLVGHLHANCFWPSTISTGHLSFKPSDRKLNRIEIRTNS